MIDFRRTVHSLFQKRFIFGIIDFKVKMNPHISPPYSENQDFMLVAVHGINKVRTNLNLIPFNALFQFLHGKISGWYKLCKR